MIEKKYVNQDIDIELIGMTSYIDDKQNVWFQGKDIALILGYSETDQALRKHTDNEDRKSYLRWHTFINESGFYSLVLSSKLKTANMG